MLATLNALSVVLLLAQSRTAEIRLPTEPIAPGVVALGGAGVVGSTDPEAILNPASLVEAPRVGLTGYQGVGDYRGFGLAGRVRLPAAVIAGFGLRHFDYGDLIEDDLGVDSDLLDVKEQAFTLTVSRSLAREVSVGAAVSYVSIDYFGSVTSAWAATAGVIVNYRRQGGLGLSLRTLGPDARSHDTGARYPLPSRIRIGVWQGVAVMRQNLGLHLDAEVPVRRREVPSVFGGIEWRPLQELALRAGYANTGNGDTDGRRNNLWSAGCAIRLKRLELAMSARFGSELGGNELMLGLGSH